MAKVAYTKTSSGARKMSLEQVILPYKNYSPDYEIMRTGQGEEL